MTPASLIERVEKLAGMPWRPSTKWRLVGWFFAISGLFVIPMLPERSDETIRQAASVIVAAISFATAAILDAIERKDALALLRSLQGTET